MFLFQTGPDEIVKDEVGGAASELLDENAPGAATKNPGSSIVLSPR